MEAMAEKLTVLVVDDDPDIRDAVSDALRDEGYQVLTALGSAVLKVSQEAQPDVILLDVMMPLVDGATLSHLLRAHPRTARIPIVAMTALPQRSAPEGLRYDAWLGKPFDLVNLFVVVDALTERTAPGPVC